MKRLFIVVEGPSELTFVNDLLGPALNRVGVYPAAVPIGLPGAPFGDVRFARARDAAVRLLRNPTAYVTTMIDFYGRGRGWPEFPVPVNEPLVRKAGRIESAAWAAICDVLGGGHAVGDRFWPYLQMHEFEGLLFSDPEAFAAGIVQPRLAAAFRKIRDEFRTPEHIDGDRNSAPSKRIERLHPTYEKVTEGNLAAIEIGLAKMRAECGRFNDWVSWMEAVR